MKAETALEPEQGRSIRSEARDLVGIEGDAEPRRRA
jgi:hypothetical protein